jgi:hypothetical protein
MTIQYNSRRLNTALLSASYADVEIGTAVLMRMHSIYT